MHTVLLELARLACPVGMALMMWMMMRGTRPRDAPSSADARGDHPSEVDALRAEVEQLKADHAARPTTGRR
jgi:hypothetical protein